MDTNTVLYRSDKNLYYLNIADAVSMRSTCLHSRYGAVIVKNDEIISTGYNGAPRGLPNCINLGFCTRRKIIENVPSQQRFDICRSVHAEANAIISASRKNILDSSLYVYGYNIIENKRKSGMPCDICKKLIINSGISKVYISCVWDSIYTYEILDNLTKRWGNL